MLISELMKDLTDEAEITFYSPDYYSGESMSYGKPYSHKKYEILANPYFDNYEPDCYTLDVEHDRLEIVE